MMNDINGLTKLGKHHLGYILSTIFEKTFSNISICWAIGILFLLPLFFSCPSFSFLLSVTPALCWIFSCMWAF